MSFDALAQAITTAAETEAAAVTQRYAEQAAKEQQRITAAAQALEESILQEAESAGQLAATRSHQDQLLATKADILAAKQQALAEVEQALVEQLLTQDDKATSALLKSLLALLPDTAGTIVAGERQADAVAKAAGRSKHTVAKETIPGDGGFIYRNDTTELNLTITELVHRVFATHRATLAQTLFS